MFVGMLSLPTLLNHSEPPLSDANNSIVEVASIEELSKTVGFAITEPTVLPFKSEQTIYTAYWTDLAEITYMGEGQTAFSEKEREQKMSSVSFLNLMQLMKLLQVI